MAKAPGIFARTRTLFFEIDGVERAIKYATPKFGFDLSNLVPAPKSVLQRLAMRGGFVPAGKRASVRSTFVTPAAMRKAALEQEEGRTLTRAEIKPARARSQARRQFIKDYLARKLRLDPRLGDPSLYHPDFWDTQKTFKENWSRDQRRFLQLAQERTGIRFQLDGATGEWTKTPVEGAPRKLMNDADWRFYLHHYYANSELYDPIKDELFEVPPGEVSPRTIRAGRSPGRANRTGRSVGSYRAQRRAA